MITHIVRINETFIENIYRGKLTFVVVPNDIDYQVGDTVKFDSNVRSPILIIARIIYITSYQQKEGNIIIGFEVLESKHSDEK